MEASDIKTDADCLRVLNGVIDRTLPKSDWTHAAHCVFAVALLGRLTLDEAEEAAPRLIRMYNEATGVANTREAGYHHTITVFFLRRIAAFLKDHEDEHLAARTRAVLASEIGSKDYPLSAYSSAELEHVFSRLDWEAPRAEV